MGLLNNIILHKHINNTMQTTSTKIKFNIISMYMPGRTSVINTFSSIFCSLKYLHHNAEWIAQPGMNKLKHLALLNILLEESQELKYDCYVFNT